MTLFARGLAPAACAALLLTSAGSVCAAPPGWLSDYRKALELSRKHGKPIIADFSTDWCPNCRKLESATFKDPSVSERLDQFIKVYIDGDKHPEMVERFGIEGFPTLVALSPQGEEIDRSVGYVNARRLAGTLDRAIRSVPPSPVQPEERKPETAVASAADSRGIGNGAKSNPKDAAAPEDTPNGTPAAESPGGAAKTVTVSKLPENANFYTMSVSREPARQVVATAPRREFQVAQAPSAAPPASVTDSGSAQLPRPLINVGQTRVRAAESAEAAPAESKPQVTVKTNSEPRTAPTEAPAASAAAPATPAVSSDPLATVRLLQSARKSSRSPAPPAPAEAAPAAAQAKTADQTPDAGLSAAPDKTPAPKPATAAVAAIAQTPPPASERSTPPREVAAVTPGSGRQANPPSRDDAERWMKDGDEKLRAGYKKEARAQYAKIVETDPANQTGYADVAFIKMVSLMVDRDDQSLRQEAYSKITEFLARYPDSPHKDYYTVIRATLAIDLDRTDEAIALLQDFPTQFPNSRFTSMAHQLWTSLPAASKPQTRGSRRR
jgi:thiol-disulfide isomerase/thioredoxin